MTGYEAGFVKIKKMHLLRRCIILAVGALLFLYVPALEPVRSSGNNYFRVYVNDQDVGSVHQEEEAFGLVKEVRKEIAGENEELILMNIRTRTEGSEKIFGQIDSRKMVKNKIKNVLIASQIETEKRAYTVKINEFTVNLQSSEEVVKLLEAAKRKYDKGNRYTVELMLDPTRELNVLTARVVKTAELKKENVKPTMVEAGVAKTLTKILEESGSSFENEYTLGLQEIGFGDTVEVVESYMNEEKISTLEDAVDSVTKNQEKKKIYEVAPGDTLSEIAILHNTTMEQLIQMNENLEDENSVIRIGDELTVTIPEPELSVVRTEKLYYEENYEAPIQYVDNDEWYTTDMKTLQDPVCGFRKVVADVTYRNASEMGREIIKEDIVMAAVPRIVERGTKTPPTYIKPLSGGRLSSGFKMRWGRMHKGIDWSCPVGTAISASCSGVIARAGWGSGYGYVIYLNHPDGRQTRYGHLSKILVKSGQKVNQGDKIALSGNTGRSTGPHVHFEILIGGRQVNPMDYLN